MRSFENILYDPRKFFASVIVLFFILPLLLMGLLAFNTSAQTTNSGGDCDNNAVIMCGASNMQQLNTGYSQSGVSAIYSHFGISAQDINNMGTNFDSTPSNAACNSSTSTSTSTTNGTALRTVMGSVNINNNVVANCRVVAHNAITAGRQFIPGSTVVHSGGMTFYQRPPSVSFASSSLPAFVVMNGNQFMFAIISSCGNPVIATPVVVKTVKPVVKTPSPTPTPPTQTTIINNNTNTNTNTVNTPPATVVQTAGETTTTPAPAAQPTSLPNTGPGAIAAFGGITTIFGTTGHLLLQRFRLKRS